MSQKKNRCGEDPTKLSLDAIAFDTIGYTLQDEPDPDDVRVWYTPD